MSRSWETSLITATAQGRGSSGQLGQLVSRLYRQLAGDLDRRLPDLAPDQIDEAPLANLHFMKGLGHYHSARYSHALAEFMLAAEDEDERFDVARLWVANAYLAQRQYAHACLELSRLVHRGSKIVQAKLRACEQHLSPEDMRIIRELIARRDANVTARPNPTEPYRFFGGRTVTVPLTIHAPEPAGLVIHAELVQLTARLTVPATKIDVSLSAYPSAGLSSGAELDLSVALPAVNRETDFELRFRSSRPGDRVPEGAGRVPLRVYPADLLSPLRAWAQSHPIRVQDDHGSVTEFFRQQNIPVTDRAEPRGITVYAGPRALQKQSRVPLRDGETAVLLSELETETPHVVIDRTGRGTTVRVEVRLVDRLATDPLAQKTLLEVFKYLHDANDQTARTQGVVR
jgi:hypothetical protein